MQFRWNGVSERDMDLLFLEEFALNEDFLNLFLQKTGNAELFSYKIVSEEVSLTDAVLGESDLTIVLEKDGPAGVINVQSIRFSHAYASFSRS